MRDWPPAWRRCPRRRRRRSPPSTLSSFTPTPIRSTPATGARTAARMPARSSLNCSAASCPPRTDRSSTTRRCSSSCCGIRRPRTKPPACRPAPRAAGSRASASPIDERLPRAPIVDDDQPRASSLYTSLHYPAERQGVPADVILQILKIHAYETDFRQRVRAGDGFEFFFDVKDDDKAMEGGL